MGSAADAVACLPAHGVEVMPPDTILPSAWTAMVKIFNWDLQVRVAIDRPSRDPTGRCGCALSRRSREKCRQLESFRPPETRKIDRRVRVRVERVRQAGRRIKSSNEVALLPANAPEMPPARIFPSACNAKVSMVPSASGLKAVSSEPSGFSRAMRLRVTDAPPFGARVVNPPAITIFPSGCTTTARK